MSNDINMSDLNNLNIDEIMRKGKEIMENAQKAEKALAEKHVVGRSDKAVVQIKFSGLFQPLACRVHSQFHKLTPEAMSQHIIQAIEDALQKIKRHTEEQAKLLMGDIKPVDANDQLLLEEEEALQ